jgi:HK97 family phage major capsid protein
MDIQKQKEKINLLQKKVDDFNRAGSLNSGQIQLRDEMLAEIQRMKRDIPGERLTLQGFGDGRTGRDVGIFPNLGSQLQSVMRAGLPGQQVDPRLYEVRVASGMSESVPADGGFLVQSDFAKQLFMSVFQTGKLAQRCGRIQISSASNSVKINAVDETSRATGSRWGGLTAYWLGENALITGTKPKFRQLNLILKKLVGLCYATDELMDDATALEGVVSKGFASEFGFLVDDAIINGTGAGQPLGILNSGCLVSVAKETGQRAASVVAENVVKMYSRLLASSLGDAVWLINQNVKPQLFTMSLSVGTGGVPVYMPMGGVSGLPYDTLFGIPVFVIEQAATVGSQGDIILADLTNGYILAEKGGIEADMSIHIRFLYDENVFRFVMRLDGQPVLSSAITPYKGTSSTQSTFVVLDARS